MSSAPLQADCRRKVDRRTSAAHPLTGALERAIADGDIEIVFQPQFFCVSGTISGAEALVRWQFDSGETLAGDALFDIAERAGLGRQLSAYIFERALRAARFWPSDLRLSLNITAADLAAPSFANEIVNCLHAAGFSPDRLTLEITEQALVIELDRSAEYLARLADQGVRVALDDFGAGFCNFRYLKALPLHYLKLDRSMVQGIVDDTRDLAVLRGIVTMAKALNLRVIAEGIEHEAQREAIAREGCDVWQGFLGAEPLGTAEFLGILDKGFARSNKPIA